MSNEDTTYKVLKEQFIKVTYLPQDSKSVFDNGRDSRIFLTFEDFLAWFTNYVCMACFHDLQHIHNCDSVKLGDLLYNTGCGVELEVDDPHNLIDLNYIVRKND